MAVDFNAWLGRSGKVRVFLVETSALRGADLEAIPVYLADRGLVLNARAYLGCVIDLPRLTRQSNDHLSPNRVPTWGELTLARDDGVNPDAANSLAWDSLLSKTYIFEGRPLTILLGGLPEDGFTYAGYQPVFQGHIGNVQWRDDQVVETLYDKGKDFEEELSPYELPECPFVAEASWGQPVPAALGFIENYKPVLISRSEAGDYPWRYALTCHVSNKITSIYFDNAPQNWFWSPAPVMAIGIDTLPGASASMERRLKDVLPAHKDGDGSATMQNFGPYTGALIVAEWQIRIATITRVNEVGQSGPEVGLAGFDWFLNGVKQNGAALLTWKLAPGAVTHDPALGGSVMTLGGEFTGESKRQERLKITQAGNFSTPGKFRLSEDGGATWGAEQSITSAAPIALGNGLTAAFTEATRVSAPTFSGTGTGSVTVSGTYTGSDQARNYKTKITSAGAQPPPVEARWRWSDDGGATWSDEIAGLPSGPYSLNRGLSVVFNAGAYNLDDEWNWWGYPPFMADDIWAFALDQEIPIPLAAGVSVQFFTQTGVDFAVGDAWRFPLGSTLCFANVGDGVNITVDLEGLISPADNLYKDKAGGIIQALLMAWRRWLAADFDAAALAAFDLAFPYKLGLLVDGPTSFGEIIEHLLTGLPALYTLDREERLYLAEVTPPSGAPVLELGEGETEIIDSPEGESGGDNVYRRVYLNYNRNHNVENSPQGAPNQERLEWLKREYRLARQSLAPAADDALRAKYPYAKDLGPLDTCIVSRADALAAAGKILDLYQEVRPPLTLQTPNLAAFLLKLGEVVRWRGDLYYLDSLHLDFTQRLATLELWN